MNARPRVVIAGGGFAGLETAFTLRSHLGSQVELVLISDRHDFLFKPNTIYIPFGGDEAKLRIPLSGPALRRNIELLRGSLAHVDALGKRVELTDGTLVPYDYLVLATGASMRPQEVPGLAEYAQTIWTPDQMRSLGASFQKIRSEVQAGGYPRVLFLVPPNNKCAGPLYEIVFMLETWLRRHHLREPVRISFTTHEETYIQAFGAGLDQVVAEEFDARGIIGHSGRKVVRVEPRRVRFADGAARNFDLLVSFPPYVAAVRYPNLPSDDRGFLLTEPRTRRVKGAEDVYAPGDAGDFPVKQAFLAFLQADAVADDIAARIDPSSVRSPRRFDPVSMCVMEMYDKATFAQVPLEATGDPVHPVRVRADASERYLVGVSPIWRLGKKMLGIYLPQQFRAGRPFHGGLPWQTMELGLKGMSKTLASSMKE